MWHKPSCSGRNYISSLAPSSCKFPMKRNLLESPQKFPKTGWTYYSKHLILVIARGGLWGPDCAARIPLWTKVLIPDYEECSLLEGCSWRLRNLSEGEAVDLSDNGLIPCLLSGNSEDRFIFRALYTICWGKLIAVQSVSNSSLTLVLFALLPPPPERNLTTMKMDLFPR